ncbi:MAG TPA: PfkB family carbohydrate kinase [Opitutaceae bacterium]|jgi:1-phosphofructokinase|nr:PfkB family carbohydrate kinase [Opitutaceae bacterium]
MKPSIFTLTGNLLWEKTLSFDRWSAGHAQRAAHESFQVGGKGINVAKMLTRLRTPATALCFPGGATGTECVAWLRGKKIPFRAFPSSASTRIGVVIRGRRHETTFLGRDTPPDAAALRACARFLAAQPRHSALAICGSFPGWDSPAAAPLRAALDCWLARGGFLAADTYGPPLAWLVQRPLGLVKINRTEFDTLFPARQRRRSVSSRLQQACRRWPVAAWIITDGPGPVWLAEKESPAPVRLIPPAVHEISATGSGDVLLACVLQALFYHRATLAGAVTMALPYAAANAANPGVAEFALNKLPKLRS